MCSNVQCHCKHTSLITGNHGYAKNLTNYPDSPWRSILGSIVTDDTCQSLYNRGGVTEAFNWRCPMPTMSLALEHRSLVLVLSFIMMVLMPVSEFSTKNIWPWPWSRVLGLESRLWSWPYFIPSLLHNRPKQSETFQSSMVTQYSP